MPLQVRRNGRSTQQKYVSTTLSSSLPAIWATCLHIPPTSLKAEHCLSTRRFCEDSSSLCASSFGYPSSNLFSLTLKSILNATLRAWRVLKVDCAYLPRIDLENAIRRGVGPQQHSNDSYHYQNFIRRINDSKFLVSRHQRASRLLANPNSLSHSYVTLNLRGSRSSTTLKSIRILESITSTRTGMLQSTAQILHSPISALKAYIMFNPCLASWEPSNLCTC